MEESAKSSSAGQNQEKALNEKDLGNEAFLAGRYQEAIDHFTIAIQLDPYNHVLFRYENRI